MPVVEVRGEKSWCKNTPLDQFRLTMGWLIGFVLVVVCWQVIARNTLWFLVWDAPQQVSEFISRMFPPRWEYLSELWLPLWDTFNIATLGTALAVILAVPLAFLAAQTLLPLVNRDPEVALPLARALANSNQSQQAATYYLQALNRIPNPSVELLQEIADTLSGIPGQESQALALYQRLSRLRPGDPAIATRLLLLENSQRPLSAQELVRRLQGDVNITAASPPDREQLTALLTRLPADKALLPFYEQLRQAGIRDPLLQVRQAEALLQAGQIEAARTVLTALIQDRPNDTTAYYVLADLEQAAGDIPAAIRAYQAITRIDPQDKDAPRAVAGLSQRLGDLPTALTAARSLVARNPGDPRAQITLAEILIASRQYGEAIDLLRPLTASTPGALLPLARAYAESGQGSFAVPLYLQALQASRPTDPAVVLEAADVARGVRGQESVAVQLLEQLSAADPQNPNYRLRLLALRAELGQIPPETLRATLLQELEASRDPDRLRPLAPVLAQLPGDPLFLPYYPLAVNLAPNTPRILLLGVVGIAGG